MRRLFDLTIATVWLCSLAGLVWHDVWPVWTAGWPPVQVPAGEAEKPVRMQFAIDSQRFGRMGQSWAEFRQLDTGAIARSTTLLESGALRKAIRVESHTGFNNKGRLDEFRLWVYGLPVQVTIEAASYGGDFPCIVTVGDERHEFTLQQETASALAEVFRPFVYLKGLHVGQTWRIASINPLGSLWGEDPAPEPVVARVAGRESIQYLGQTVPCFRVETRGAVAWVDDQGQVLLQEVELPMLGKVSIRLLDGFDQEALLKARG
jgi:hypothetical protein